MPILHLPWMCCNLRPFQIRKFVLVFVLVFAGIICSSSEWLASVSILLQLALTASNNVLTLKNLSLLFSGLTFRALSTTCENSRTFSYRLSGIIDAIGLYRVSLFQYISYWGIFTTGMNIWILINCSISAWLLILLLPVFWALYKLASFNKRSVISLLQNCLKYFSGFHWISSSVKGPKLFGELLVYSYMGEGVIFSPAIYTIFLCVIVTFFWCFRLAKILKRLEI